MVFYIILDLYLGFNVEKLMDIFGDKWKNYFEKIRENWINKVIDEDMVFIVGDIFWLLKEQDSKYDLDWINELLGKKIISKGNYDYWWGSIFKLNVMYENIKFF